MRGVEIMEVSRQIDYIHLPEKTVLGGDKYIIERRLTDRSNMSIVYLARDQEGSQVVIKEFYPKNMALRDLDGTSVVCKQRSTKKKFQKRKELFLNEAKIMADLDEINNIAVCKDYFEENNTVYLVSDYYSGPTLEEIISDGDMEMDSFLDDIYFPLLKAVRRIHKKNYIHRDIKPSNIILTKKGPVLIDFGSAINYKRTDTKKIFLTPGFSPIEFYSEKAEQGSFSDIYSLAAILYYYLEKIVPEEAVNRIIEDDLENIKATDFDISRELKKLIVDNLSLDKKKRCKSVRLLQLRLYKDYIRMKIRSYLPERQILHKLFNS